jgi:hypothetical protein
MILGAGVQSLVQMIGEIPMTRKKLVETNLDLIFGKDTRPSRKGNRKAEKPTCENQSSSDISADLEKVKRSTRLFIINDKEINPKHYGLREGLKLFFLKFFDQFVDVEGLKKILASSCGDKNSLLAKLDSLVDEDFVPDDLHLDERMPERDMMEELWHSFYDPWERRDPKETYHRLHAIFKQFIQDYRERFLFALADAVLVYQKAPKKDSTAPGPDRVDHAEDTTPNPQLREFTPENVFRIDDVSVRITYQGRTLPALKKSAGMKRLQYLLLHPGQNYSSPMELDAALEPRSIPMGRIIREDEAKHEGLRVLGKTRIDHDMVGLRKLKEDLERIAREIEQASKDNDVARKIRLEEEKESILKQIRRITATKRRKADWDLESKKIKTKLRNSINPAILKIEKADPQLGKHLSLHFKRLIFPFSYDPQPPEPWVE